MIPPINCSRCGILVEHPGASNQKYCSECSKLVTKEIQALYRSNHVNTKKVKVSGKGSTKKNKRLCEIAKAADKAGMSYGQYVLKNGLY